jgi:hypothetical protein
MLHPDHACLLDIVAWNGILIFEPETFFERILSCLKIKKQNIGYSDWLGVYPLHVFMEKSA